MEISNKIIPVVSDLFKSWKLSGAHSCVNLQLYWNKVNLDERDFYSTSRILLRCTHLGRDWLSTRSAVTGATFMNEFAPYAMQAPPLKRRTRQRFTWLLYTEESDTNKSACFIKTSIPTIELM